LGGIGEANLGDSFSCDAEGGGGAVEEGAMTAGAAAVDDGMDVAKGVMGGVEEFLERHSPEAIDPGEHGVVKGLIFFKGAAGTAAAGVVGGTVLLAVFGDAAAFLTGFTDMDAFFDHDFLQKEKGASRGARAFFISYSISSEYQV
jgi:hypothetical protein